MTSANLTQPVERSAAPFGDDDPRMTLGQAVALGSAVIAAVRPDQLAGPTPCDDFAVRDLMGHLVTVLRRVAVMGQGGDPFAVPFVSEVPDGAHADAWRAAAHEVMAAWSDVATLDRVIALPWATMTGGETLEVYANEVTLHTWDLAAATGQQPAWDDEVVRRASAALADKLPPDLDRSGAPFAAAVTVPVDAPPIVQLVAYSGRRPDWAA